MSQTNPGSTPVGTVLMYAGSTSGSSIFNLYAAGWIICDGSTYPFTQFPDLYKVIGRTYGGNEEAFAVPSYQGLFLRGVDAKADRDKEADKRTAPRPDLPVSGNAGVSVGSLQMDDFASHTHIYSYYNKYRDTSHTLPNKSLSGSQQNTFNASGGNETRPVNQYVNFIIKAVASPDAVPVGAVVPYAGDIKNDGNFLAAGWLPCIGANLKIADYNTLFQTISSFYGAEDASTFRLPDFRGQFIRGVQGEVPSNRKIMDPDYLLRQAPQPGIAFPGNTGNKPGSVQDSLYASHTHAYTYNNDYWSTAATAIGWKAEALNSETWTSGANSNALKETRPDNINVNYLIKF